MVRVGFAIALVGLLSVLSVMGIVPTAIAASLNSPSLSMTPITDVTSGGTTVAALFSFSGTRPNNLGVKDGKLAACPNTPNCVSSQSPASDQEHYIAPLSYSGDAMAAMANLKSVIEGMERTAIITESENYLYAEFTSALMGFVDDVEFFLDQEAGVIHVRSASRLGQSDLGVNRKRVEAIRSKLAA
jgi:uncharacterized protein (DUF1499 family)